MFLEFLEIFVNQNTEKFLVRTSRAGTLHAADADALACVALNGRRLEHLTFGDGILDPDAAHVRELQWRGTRNAVRRDHLGVRSFSET